MECSCSDRSLRADSWDLSIYVHLTPEASLRRGVARDSLLMGGTETATDRYHNHHLAGQARYHAEASPIDVADIVIENADYENLVIARVS
jgi:pantothenate kinase